MKTVHVKDSFQDYTYELTERMDWNFDPEFEPDLTPKQMLELGVSGAGNRYAAMPARSAKPAIRVT